MDSPLQYRAKAAGGQDQEVKYEAGKTGASKAEVKEAVKSEGNSRKRVEDSSARGDDGGWGLPRAAAGGRPLGSDSS